MRLFEAIIDANHRAIAGDATAGLHPADFADALPVIALTCVDPRLNSLFPNALALPAEQFIWLRNAGNIITGPLSSTMRSLALSTAIKGGREIAIIGHTDCAVAKTPTMKLMEELQALGVDRRRLPDNLAEFFGTFGGERQNVIKACDFARASPLIGPKIPVHGLIIDTTTGKLDWVVNGYQTWNLNPRPDAIDFSRTTGAAIGSFGSVGDFTYGEMKFPDAKIGDAAFTFNPSTPQPVPTPPATQPPPIVKTSPPSPPPLKPGMQPPPPRIRPPQSSRY